MRDLAIAIRIGSRDSTLELVRGTIQSIEENIGKCDYKFILSLDPEIKKDVKDFIYLCSKKNPERFELLPEETVYWAEFINKAIKLAYDCRYFIKAHDDIILQTPDFFPRIKEIIENFRTPVAWISFNETSYLDGHWNPPTRPGYYRDFLEENAWEARKMFYLHDLPEGWWKPNLISQILYQFQLKVISKVNKEWVIFKCPTTKMRDSYRKLLDFPSGPVKCHAPWNTFVLIKMAVLKELGECENWQTYNALLVDEDWGLRALEKGYSNVWVPKIEYYHVKPAIGGDRSQFQIKQDSKRVAELFFKKWGFNAKPAKEDLNFIKNKYKNNLISWSIGKNSYDWDYII